MTDLTAFADFAHHMATDPTLPPDQTRLWDQIATEIDDHLTPTNNTDLPADTLFETP